MSNKQLRVLVVDDEIEIANAIKNILKAEGYKVDLACNGVEALEKMGVNTYQLLLLDIMMPKMDGFSAIMKIREKYNIPIILLSAKSEESDKILGLSMGADDYITKPFSRRELAARVNAVIRRFTVLGDDSSKNRDGILENGELQLNQNTKELNIGNKTVSLTATEYAIVELMMENPGMVFSTEHIYESVWKEKAYQCENTVSVHIKRIREKIEDNSKEPKYLKVVWGIGYKMEKL